MGKVSSAWLSLLVLSGFWTPNAQGQASPAGSSKRPVAVADSIEMNKLGDLDLYWGSPFLDRLAHFSPDGKKVVVVARMGNLKSNTKDYSLLFWQTADLLNSPSPRTILTMSSSSNRQGIKDLRWLADNETLAFLGEHPGELQQVFTYNVGTRLLKKITHHRTNVLAFSATPDGKEIAYIAEQPKKSVWTEKARREGLVISTQQLSDLIRGETSEAPGDSSEVFLQLRDGTEHKLGVSTKIDWSNPAVSLSPNGKFILVPVLVREIPDLWKEYSDPEIQRLTSQQLRPGLYSELRQCELIDASNAEAGTLIKAPLGPGGMEARWSPDGRSVVVNNTFLPLDAATVDEHKERQSSAFAVEVQVLGGKFSKVTSENLVLLDWDSRTGLLRFADWSRAHENREGAEVFFRKNAGNWENVKPPLSLQDRPRLIVEEDMNTPPKLFAIDPKKNQKALLFDPNPQFKQLRFAKVEQIHWKASDGHEVGGGLYYPLHFALGQKYPLVIQTHGWMPEAFWIDGPFTTAFAAQPLAGKDIMVLQVEEEYGHMGTPEEVKGAVSAFEGAIHYLDEKGIIDRDRVGIIGFSRTCLFVKYALTHSKYHFAAASVTDGVDAGYFQYIALLNAFPGIAEDFEKVNESVPFGEGLRSWMRRSPGFSLEPESVQTPLRITALNSSSILWEWEWFAALSKLGKPVEMTAIEDGDHVLQKPRDRMVSQQGDVDWFCFWLKGEQDPDPAKAEQYARWNKMCAGHASLP
jgi:dipeptidyl aminopeptidase/acylaminoacyl peptidase